MAVLTRRWAQGDRVWFGAAGLDEALGRGAERVGYGRAERDGEVVWGREHSARAAFLDAAWSGFSRCAEAMFRQGARLDPVPWREALRELCRRTEGTGIDWWLTGSAAVAVRGGRVAPQDLDLVCAARDVHRLGELLADSLVDPIGPELDEYPDWISDWWGRGFLGARVEWVGGVRSHADQPEPADFGLIAAARLETVAWEDWRIRVPPLDMQRAVSVRRGLAERVAAIDALRAGS